MADGGLGLRVVRSLAAQLGATIRFNSNPLGTRVQPARCPSPGVIAA